MGHILELFLENPVKAFHIRGISRQLKIPKTTVSYQIMKLLDKKIIVKQKKDVFTSFRADESSEIYRFEKKNYFFKKLFYSGLIKYLEELNPRCIMLFGSFAKGEYDEKSDIDIFVQAKETTIDIKKFEKLLKHKINILFEPDLKKMSKELLNNIINGIKLGGFLKI